MVVGTGRMVFRLYDCRSLKEKRGIVKSIVGRIRNKFNVSMAETGLNDSLSMAEIGFSVTGNDRRFINATMDKIINMADEMNLAPIVETDMDIISY
ncbi:MAG: DUF503 domain-containing protein [Pseudomonadota bacterium]